MRHWIITALALIIVAQSEVKASCRDKYVDNKVSITGDDMPDNWGLAAFGAGAAAGGAFIGGIGAVLVGGVAGPIIVIGTVKGVQGLSNIKENKMIRLIDESNDYLRDRKLPGKVLKRLHQKVKKQMPDLTIEDLANTISISNEDESLCRSELLGLQQMKRALKNNSFPIIELE